jgi:hypothetical protein
MADAVSFLNRKGLRTEYCCQGGHGKRGGSWAYVLFASGVELPVWLEERLLQKGFHLGWAPVVDENIEPVANTAPRRSVHSYHPECAMDEGMREDIERREQRALAPRLTLAERRARDAALIAELNAIIRAWPQD